MKLTDAQQKQIALLRAYRIARNHPQTDPANPTPLPLRKFVDELNTALRPIGRFIETHQTFVLWESGTPAKEEFLHAAANGISKKHKWQRAMFNDWMALRYPDEFTLSDFARAALLDRPQPAAERETATA